MKENKLLRYMLALSMMLVMGMFVISCGSKDVNPPAPDIKSPIVLHGTGYAVDENGYRASLSLDVNEESLSTSWLEFSYLTDYLMSTSITEVSESGGDVIVWTIRGIGTLSGQEGFTFTGTVTDGNPQEIAIEILDPDGVEYLTMTSLQIVS